MVASADELVRLEPEGLRSMRGSVAQFELDPLAQPASNTPSLKIGRSAPNTITSSWGNRDVNSATGFLIADHIKEDVDLFSARLNYKFGGPAVARY